MTNPIQTVLEAEATARQIVETARRQARNTIQDARAQARHISERNEARIQKAIKRYRQHCDDHLAQELDALNQEARAMNKTFVNNVQEHMDGIVAELFGSLWPKK